MEKISQLMDGEIEGQECSCSDSSAGQGPAACSQTWDTYHLIRDVLRDEAGTRLGLGAAVHERLRGRAHGHRRRAPRWSLACVRHALADGRRGGRGSGGRRMAWVEPADSLADLPARTDSTSPAAKVVSAEGAEAAGR